MVSRLVGVSLDVPRADEEKTTTFWAGALDRRGEREADDADYTSFGEATPGVEFFVQAVGDAASRIHLDLEADDVDAEVARLVGLGATEVERIQSWVVMHDPVGITFCILARQIPISG